MLAHCSLLIRPHGALRGITQKPILTPLHPPSPSPTLFSSMKRLSLLAGFLLLLTACQSSAITYELSFQKSDAILQSELAIASMNVVEAKLANWGEVAVSLDIAKQNGITRLSVELSDAKIVDVLTEDLITPFDFSIMERAGPGDTVDVQVEHMGNFTKTGVKGDHILWMEAEEEPGIPRKGRILMNFTPEGHEMMKGIFKKNVGDHIGIFVKDRVIALLLVEKEEVEEQIVISEVSTLELANTFANDVNVGLFVTFTPVQ